MAKAEVLVYTEKELEAIEILKNNAGSALTAEQLGISNAVLTSLRKKANDERPMADGSDKVVIEVSDVEIEYTATKTVKAYKLA